MRARRSGATASASSISSTTCCRSSTRSTTWRCRRLIAGRKRSEVLADAERLLAIMGLADRMHHQPAQLSGGEQQRVAIARAMINNPLLILADEPTGNLDPDTSTIVFAALSELVRKQGAAALIATHNFELTKYMDRVMGLDHGRLVQREDVVTRA